MNPILLTLLGISFIFIMSTLGAGLVFFFKRQMSINFKRLFLGFAAGVMTAASVWSLLVPAFNEVSTNRFNWLIIAVGFSVGGLFLFLVDLIIPHLHDESNQPEGVPTSLKKNTLLYLAVLIHNIPEGLAVGFAFGLALTDGSSVAMMAAIGLALGIGLQNFPEGAAVSMMLKDEGRSRRSAFLYGVGSGIVEPIFAVIGLFLAMQLVSIMPWLLTFAAGAMIYVVVEELIPQAHLGEHSHLGTFGFMAGFLIMMILDVTFV